MGREVSRVTLADCFGVSLPTIDAMVRRGMPVVARGGRGIAWKFDLTEAIRWREAEVARLASGGRVEIELDEARRRKVAAEAALAELDLSIRRGDALSLNDAAKIWESMVSVFRHRCLAIPAKLAPALVAATELVAVRGMLEREINEALRELAAYEPGEFRESAGGDPGGAGADQGGGGAGAASAAVDGEPVGGSVSAAQSGGRGRAGRLAH